MKEGMERAKDTYLAIGVVVADEESIICRVEGTDNCAEKSGGSA